MFWLVLWHSWLGEHLASAIAKDSSLKTSAGPGAISKSITYLTYCHGDAKARVSNLPACSVFSVMKSLLNVHIHLLAVASNCVKCQSIFSLAFLCTVDPGRDHAEQSLGICCLAALRHDQNNGDDVGVSGLVYPGSFRLFCKSPRS